MAVTGLIMIGYLLAHMYGNLKVFAGQATFDDYAHHLRDDRRADAAATAGCSGSSASCCWSACSPTSYAAVALWRRARIARGGTKRYYSNKARTGVQRSYASFTLRWGGIVIALFVVYHLLHLTWNVVAPGGPAPEPVRAGGQRLPDLVGGASSTSSP